MIVLNTCVVRQSAEDHAVGHLWSLKPLKDHDPQRVIALMGCMVGIKPNPACASASRSLTSSCRPPTRPRSWVSFRPRHRMARTSGIETEARVFEDEQTEARHFFQDYGSPEAAAMGLVDDLGLQIPKSD